MLRGEICLTDLSELSGSWTGAGGWVRLRRTRGLKQSAFRAQLPGLVLADDSGLEVDSLGGAPGVFSARYAGCQARRMRRIGRSC